MPVLSRDSESVRERSTKALGVVVNAIANAPKSLTFSAPASAGRVQRLADRSGVRRVKQEKDAEPLRGSSISQPEAATLPIRSPD